MMGFIGVSALTFLKKLSPQKEMNTDHKTIQPGGRQLLFALELRISSPNPDDVRMMNE